MKPGVYELPMDEYRADPCEEPSLSHSIAKILLAESPAHARKLHPRLNGGHFPPHRKTFDLGTAMHAYFLEGEDVVVRVPAKDFKTHIAQALRDQAYADGKIPLSQPEQERFAAAMESLHRAIGRLVDSRPPFCDGQPERTLIWQEPSGVWCRARPDWLRSDCRTMDDLKIVGGSANTGTAPGQFGRAVFALGHDIQAALYRRGARALGLGDPQFRFVAFELKKHECTLSRLSAAGMAVADSKVERAIRIFGECLEADRWPGYANTVQDIEPPAYEIALEEAEAAALEGY